MGVVGDAAVDERRFEIRGQLGAGGMGAVYRAFDRRLEREVALKLLRLSSGRDLYRFKREFRSLAGLVHPNLVQLHELHTNGEDWFFTMDLVPGVSFLEWVRGVSAEEVASPQGPIDGSEPTQQAVRPRTRQDILDAPLHVDRLRDAFPQLVEGVLALHIAGKLHRDLKPSNVLVSPGGRVVLLDFGLVAEVDSSHTEHTHERAAVGTPAYMSPEQALDDVLTEASDWYSVGVMLYEALAGRRPIEGPAEALLRDKQHEVALSPRDLDSGVPADLDRLAMALLARSPARRPDGRGILAALGREPTQALEQLEQAVAVRPFVGRAAELALLRGALADAARRTVAVFVQGESGIGKSQLVRTFLDEVGDQARVIEGRCYERESVPFKALDAVVDALATALLALGAQRTRALLTRNVGALARLFPVLRRVPAVGEQALIGNLPVGAQELRRRAFLGLREILSGLASERPLVIAIDDLQWGDADSAVFLAELIHDPEPLPILVLLIHRHEDDRGIVTQVRTSPAGIPLGDLRALTLGPLSDVEALELVRALGSSEVTGQFLVREAGGHPLFLAELAQTTSRHRNSLATIEDLIARRIESLPPPAAALLRTTAVAARPVPVDLAARAAGVAVGTELLRLRAERLVRVRHPTASQGDHLEPYHDRVRAAVVATLAADQLAATHAALAAAYEAADDSGDREALVAHWMGAGRPDRAVVYAAEAAASAEAALAFHRAADLYAVALAHGTDDERVRRGLHRDRGEALANAGRLDEAAEAFAAAARGAPPDEALDCERLQLEQVLRRGRLAEGLALSRRLLAHVDVDVPLNRGAGVRALIVQLARGRLRGLRTTERAEGEVAPGLLRKVDLLFSASTSLAMVDPVIGRLVQCHFLRAALDAGEPRRLCLALAIELGYLGQLGWKGLRRIERVLDRVRALADHADDPYARGLASTMQGFVSAQLGRWKDARLMLEAGIRVMREHGTGVRWEVDVAEIVHLSALFYLGEMRELARLVPLQLREAVERGDGYAQDGLRGWRGNVAWLVADKPGEARAQVASVEWPLPPAGEIQVRHWYELQSHVHIDLYLGDIDAAWQRLEAAWPTFEASHLLRLQTMRLETAFLRGRVALGRAIAGRDPAVMVALARKLATQLDDEDAPWGQAFAAQLRAMLAVASGQRRGAGKLLEAAERAYAASDMQLLADVMRLRRGDIGAGPTGSAWAVAALNAIRDMGIVAPHRMARMLCPWPE